ncbi:MAG: HEPN domain-containing protein [Dehalococcoidia bacterium]|nr:HEPN domain-containing protein [Dehalococcoidia bacterium]
MRPDTINWIEASDYDLESARHMLSSGRYLYVVFLCHLALEKLLKAIVAEASDQPAPRTHDLIQLVKRSGIEPEERHLEFMGKLNSASIPTRYPSDIRQAVKEYNKKKATSYLEQTEEIVAWLKAHPILVK